MIILGIDPALVVTGYGVIELKKNNLFLVEAGIISTTPKQNSSMRLEKIYKAVAKLISDTKPQVVILEKIYAHYRHPTTAYALGQARGVICLAVAQKNIPLVEYAATRIKKSIVGMGHASKAQVQKAVANVLNLRTLPKYADVTDALALAIAHSYIARLHMSHSVSG